MMNESLGNAETPPEDAQDAPESTQTEKPQDISREEAPGPSGDPRKEMVECKVVKEDGTPRHDKPVAAIYCLSSCMETAKCKMAGELRTKYPGFEIKQAESRKMLGVPVEIVVAWKG